LNRKYFASLSIAAVLTIGGLGTSASAHSSVDDLKKQQDDVSSKKEEVNGKIDSKKSEINETVSKQKDIQGQIDVLGKQLNDTESKIKDKEKEIDDTTAEINKLKEEIEVLKQKIEERNELLKERARAIQEKGGSANYVDVLLGADSFGDFVNRVTAVNTIVSADKRSWTSKSVIKKNLKRNRNR